jgi:hypothetical protein
MYHSPINRLIVSSSSSLPSVNYILVSRERDPPPGWTSRRCQSGNICSWIRTRRGDPVAIHPTNTSFSVWKSSLNWQPSKHNIIKECIIYNNQWSPKELSPVDWLYNTNKTSLCVIDFQYKVRADGQSCSMFSLPLSITWRCCWSWVCLGGGCWTPYNMYNM